MYDPGSRHRFESNVRLDSAVVFEFRRISIRTPVGIDICSFCLVCSAAFSCDYFNLEITAAR